MHKKYFVLSLCCLVAAVFAVPVFAVNRAWVPTGNTSNDFATSGNWTPSPNPGANDRAFLTNNTANNSTNISYEQTASYQMFGAADVGIIVSNSNTAGQGINMLYVRGSSHFEMQGMVIGNNGIVQIANGQTLSAYSQATLSSGGTLWMNGGVTRLNGENSGTFTVNGTVRSDNGTLDGSPFANNNVNFVIGSGGMMIANTGTFYLNVDGAFNGGGLRIDSGGTLQVNSGATFVLDRDANAWFNGPAPTNNGTIFMNAGTITSITDGNTGQAATNFWVNNGTIIGSGTLAASFRQGNADSTIASNGVLNLFGTYNSGQATYTFSGASTEFGTFKAVSNGVLKLIGNVNTGMGGSWIVDAGGTMEVASVSVDLGAAFMPGSQLNGRVKIGSGGNFTLSGATGINGQTLQQNGTFEFAPGTSARSAIFMPNLGGLSAFTNAGTFILSGGSASGSGTFQGGVAGGSSYGFVNSGNIIVGSGGTMLFNSLDATATAFSNTTAGTIIVTNGSTLKIGRTDGGWAGAAQVVNMGNMILSNATVLTSDGAAGTTLAQGRIFRNAGVIVVQGDSSGNVTSLWLSTLLNAGNLYITNNNAALQIGNASTVGASTNATTGSIILGANGAAGVLVATNGPNGNQFANLGVIQGQGTMTLGRNNATGGQNNNFVNSGNLVATNWGGAAAGTLFISTGNAFSNGGFSNTTAGTIHVATNTTLTVNRSQNAWTGSGNSVANLGTIQMRGGTLNLASDGIVSNSASFINTGFIEGYGFVDSVVITTNGGRVLAVATNLSSVGTLTFRVASTTNNSTSTLGVLGTNSVLNILTPGSQNVLLNLGTISLSAGSITFNSGAAGTITNFATIAGVGDLSSFPVVNSGAGATVVAQQPVQGITALIATVGPTNLVTLGASTNAELRLTVSGGGNALVNQNKMFLDGGSITVGGASGVISNDANGVFFGRGTNVNALVTSATTSKIVASNGVLRVGLLNNLNTGSLEAFGSSDTLALTNSIIVNQGTMKANGGTIDLTGSIVTNVGTILGAGNYPDSLINTNGGLVHANGGVMNLGTASAQIVNEVSGTFRITAGTLSVAAGAWNNSGLITNASGAVLNRDNGDALTGVLTNSGLIVNLGTIGVQVINSGNITNAGGTFSRSLTNQTGGFILSSGGTFSGSTFANLGGIVKATNSDVRINSTTVRNTGVMIGGTGGATLIITNLNQNMVNQGTMLLDSAAGGNTNVAFDIRRTGGAGDFTNEVGGLIQGAGFFKTADFIGGGQNFTEWNKGSIIATNGALIMQPGDAFGDGGWVNMAGATVTVASASTLGIQRSSNAWENVGSTRQVRNEGVIQINGGSFTLYASGLQVNGWGVSNAPTGRIQGTGTISAEIINAGTIDITSDGQLWVNAGTGADTDNAWGIKNLGTIVLSTNRTLVLNRTAAEWSANEGLNDSGTLRFNGGVYQSAVAGAINSTKTNFVSQSGTGGIYGNGTFDTVLNAQAGTLSAEGGTLNFTRAVVNTIGNGVTAQAIGAGNVLQFFGGASLSASSTLKANSGGEVRFVGTTSSTLAGSFDNTGGFLTITGAQTVFFTNNLARRNLGTTTVSSGGKLNYGGIAVGSTAFTNTTTGTIKSIGPTGGTITGVGAGENQHFINNGTLIAGAGSTLTMDPGNAHTIGFSNTASGRIIVEDAAATFIISRTTAAWTDPGSDQAIKNMGTIMMNGGTFATFNDGGASPTTTRTLQNEGWVEGFGFFRATLTNMGTVNVNSGILSVSRLENTATGIININAGSTLTNTDLSAPGWVNRGLVNLNNGTLTANGTFENRGNLNVIGATGTITPGSQTRNFGDILVQDGQLTVNGALTNQNTGDIFVSNSTFTVTGALRNINHVTLFNSTGSWNQVVNTSGARIVVSNSNAGAAVTRLNVSGSVTNAGTVFFHRSLGVFDGTVVNSGAWVTDPTTNVFNATHTETSGGYISAAANDVFIFRENLVNQSTQSNNWNTLNVTPGSVAGSPSTKFIFDDDSANGTQQWFHAGLLLTGGFVGTPTPLVSGVQTVSSFAAVSGFVTNFSLGRLEIGNTDTNSIVMLSDSFPGGSTNALFVNDLWLFGTSKLIISNDTRVYFVNSNTWDFANNITLLGNAEIHQLVLNNVAVIPEPGVLLLWGGGLAVLVAARRRAHRRQK